MNVEEALRDALVDFRQVKGTQIRPDEESPVRVIAKMTFGIDTAKPKEIPDDYDVQIKQLRHRLGLTQTEFAKFIGVSLTTVSYWENRKFIPSKLAWQEFLRLSQLQRPLKAEDRFCDDKIPDDCHKQIKQLRLRLGLSQIEFAKFFGFNVSMVQRWETRKRVPSKLAWQKIIQNL